MVKFEELKVEQLKKELAARGLVTSGTKAELQKRLREAVESNGGNIDDMSFDYVTDAPQLDMNVLLGLLSEIKGDISASNKELKADISDSNKEITDKMDHKMNIMDSKMDGIKGDITEINGKIESKFKEVDDSIQSMQKQQLFLEQKISSLENKVVEIERAPPIIRSNPETNVTKMKAPTFDGTTSLNVFKLQFETIASSNAWNRREMASTLVVALRGSAAEVLQMIPPDDIGNYEAIMAALQRRFGSEHKKQIYQMEAINRKQYATESLKEYATDIERLGHLAYAGECEDYREKLMIQTFVAGIRDPEIKKAALCFPKSSFAETVAFALTQETATLLSKPVYKVREVQAEQENPITAICAQIKKAIESGNNKKFNGSCYNCGAKGHIARNCTKRQTQRRARETSPTKQEQQEALN